MGPDQRYSWKCVECRSAEPKTSNINTPVRGHHPAGHANVNVHRGAQALVDLSLVGPEGDSSVMEVSYTDGNTTPRDNGLNLTSVNDSQLLVTELRLFREEMRAMSLEIRALRTSLQSLSARIDGCDGRIDELCARVESLESGPQQSDSGVNKSLAETVSLLRLELNDRDQELLLNDIEISSVPETNGENAMHLVTTLGQKLGIELTEHDIVDATRVGRAPQLQEGVHGPAARPRPLVVRLARRVVRDRLLQAARVRRGVTTEGTGIPGRTCRFYVNERLTPHNRRLLYKARELKQQYSWRYVWTRDGKIFARQQAGMASPRYRIRTEADLDRVFGR
ncbi:uncharacterized protein LOC125238207 [Leguminivora glycinivorella]|uniref:uncharacterized protein LOC125238207 n=1 Tax=Leguminivora glycinivorella TaxID=1035111 RepID=UPI00200CB49E|nr:uncharacterized protein LOC125238207 [Leguminivora glycinivorella]